MRHLKFWRIEKITKMCLVSLRTQPHFSHMHIKAAEPDSLKRKNQSFLINTSRHYIVHLIQYFWNCTFFVELRGAGSLQKMGGGAFLNLLNFWMMPLLNLKLLWYPVVSGNLLLVNLTTVVEIIPTYIFICIESKTKFPIKCNPLKFILQQDIL